MIETLVTAIHIIICLALILVILLQSGKGGGVSAAFGGGAGAALGQRGAATVLGKFTGVAAFIFMVTSMCLAVFSTPTARDRTLDDVDMSAQAPESGQQDAKASGDKKAEPAKKSTSVPAKAAKGAAGTTPVTGKQGTTSVKVEPATPAPAKVPAAPARPGDPPGKE